jgi:hypothetical protein
METIVTNTNYDLHRTKDSVNRLLALQVPGTAILTSQIDPSIFNDLLLENLARHHQLVVLTRNASRPRLKPLDRAFWAWLCRT